MFIVQSYQPFPKTWPAILRIRWGPFFFAPGVYKAEKPGDQQYAQYALVKSSRQIYMFSFPGPSLGTTVQDLWPDISLYQPQSETLNFENLSGSEIVKILPEEEFRRVTQPRPFSVCLVGEYGGGSDGSDRGRYGNWYYYNDYYKEGLKILPDGSVHWTPAHSRLVDVEYYPSYCQIEGPPEPIVLQVESVSRPDNWTVKLHPGQEPRLEVVYPPLCCVKMSNGRMWDLSELGFDSQSALLSSTRISYHGSIKETEGSDCIVSFPGRYADGWRECVQASSHDMGVACVFLCGRDDGFGQHAIDPDADGRCYCHKIYGCQASKFKAFGYKDQQECWANGNLPTWGCLWFEKWSNNVEAAVEKKQRLIAYFFMGQVGQGLVAWDDLAEAELWNGKGLGGSQKSELAFLQKQGYEFEMRDVQEFIEGFSKESMEI